MITHFGTTITPQERQQELTESGFAAMEKAARRELPTQPSTVQSLSASLRSCRGLLLTGMSPLKETALRVHVAELEAQIAAMIDAELRPDPDWAERCETFGDEPR